MEQVNYYLVLEKRLGDYILIDINKLDICNNVVTNDIASIDAFTMLYSESEIKSSIERSNMATLDYLNGNLKIISDAKHKHNLPIITKDMYLIINEFQTSNFKMNQDMKNKIFGLYKKIIESLFTDSVFIKGLLNRLKESLRYNNKLEMFQIIEELPYNRSRNIYIEVYNMEAKRKEELVRNLKLNDVA